ncbi:hypothetical protein Vafri_16033 [Volvox africanus]|uniref:Uncharacterized protein n=1 Tax=Volvox africanus TaxID=51714 RepID=A0A8J4F8G8_9CHLO|nr:hypothetical protein Vafri_16033 [Volvox africanus]
MVTVAEILKKEGWAVEKSLRTGLETLESEGEQRSMSKPKMEVVLGKSSVEVSEEEVAEVFSFFVSFCSSSSSPRVSPLPRSGVRSLHPFLVAGRTNHTSHTPRRVRPTAC